MNDIYVFLNLDFKISYKFIKTFVYLCQGCEY